MASETESTAAAAAPAVVDDRPQGVFLPVTLMVLTVIALVMGIVWVVDYIQAEQTLEGKETRFVLQRMEETVPFFENADPGYFWGVVLFVVGALAVVYVVWMYIRDSRTIGLWWASFLATLRCIVYAILIWVFLLPALQVWERSEQYSKVLILFDLSGSMQLSDEAPVDDKPMPTRLDQVVEFLTEEQSAFLKKLQEKNPISLYAFGGRLDESFEELKSDQVISPEALASWLQMDFKQWMLKGLSETGKEEVRKAAGFDPEQPGTIEWANDWLRLGEIPTFTNETDRTLYEKKRDQLPDRIALYQQVRGATNYGDSLLTMLNRESNNMLAGIIVIGDGQNNQGSPSTYDEIRSRSEFIRVPIFAINVGQEREQINIRITDLQAPEQAPPDDKFMVRVEADGEGLPEKEFNTTIDVFKPNEEEPAIQMEAKGVFKPSSGSVPHGQVEFEIDPADPKLEGLTVLDKMSGKREFPEGEWRFVAHIPRAKGEAFREKLHKSDIASVQIVKRPLRVLLAAGGPTREYQFVRRLFVNEVDKKRAEMSVYLQVTDPKGARVQDVPNERLLKVFPDALRPPDDNTIPADEKYYNLGQYDVIIAFDLDWGRVPLSSLELLETWVRDQAGGLVLIGGPIYTWKLAHNYEQLKPIVDMYPVHLTDSRLAGQNLDRPADEPWRLNFHDISEEAPFLQIDDSKDNPAMAWEEFFTGKRTLPNPEEKPKRGFYAYYPVKGVKANARLIATFGDPRGRIIRADDPNKTQEQPYLVSMQYGGGKVVYISSGEMWRLRLYREKYHERFWNKMTRYAGAGTQFRQTSRGVLVMARQFTAGGYVRLEARLRGANLNEPLPQSAEPKIKITPPDGVVMKPSEFKLEPKKEGDWDGWFRGRFEVKAPGDYRLDLMIPGTNDSLQSRFIVQASNPELDNAKPDPALMYALASPVSALRINDHAKSELRRKLEQSYRPDTIKDTPANEGQEPHLFFDLKSAETIPNYLTTDHKAQSSRGPVEDLWDKPFDDETSWWIMQILWAVAFVTTVGLAFFPGVYMLVWGKGESGPRILAGSCLISGALLLLGISFLLVHSFTGWWPFLPPMASETKVAIVLTVVVGLLSVEWLTRKLLRLA